MIQTHPGSPVIVRFNQVSFSYGQVPVLEDVSFHIHEGEFVALIGPNGAGKTTILKLILGLIEPSTGEISLFGNTPHERRNLIGYVPQHAPYDPAFPITVEHVVRTGRLHPRLHQYSEKDMALVKETLDRMELSDLAKRPYHALSGGQRKRVLIARALCASTRLLVLDEPTANMDVESESRLFRTLGHIKGRTTILIVTHDTGFVSSLTDRVLCLGDRSASGKARTVVQHQIEPTTKAPMQLFGGEALQVLHDSSIPDECCQGGN